MHKRRIIFIIIFFFILIQGFGQNVTHHVYLKNGSIIKGKIIENVPGDHIKIKCKDGNIWAFKESEIEKTEDYSPQLNFLYTDLGMGVTISDNINGEIKSISFGDITYND